MYRALMMWACGLCLLVFGNVAQDVNVKGGWVENYETPVPVFAAYYELTIISKVKFFKDEDILIRWNCFVNWEILFSVSKEDYKTEEPILI